ncbi:hypothetical protein MAR_024067 [Mya arenaria]|uniref:PH domain-containing protein n=1 Tax=Mya arenaria TaxID=6604 RepID=A0ABY7DSV9_MYAAR|nr:hypothetical protein MAR_024067 [Mya arenaria]
MCMYCMMISVNGYPQILTLCHRPRLRNRRPYAFDVSNKPKQRIYRFAAEDEDNFLKWKLSFAKAMSPVDMDEDDEFALFGIFYTKTHLTSIKITVSLSAKCDQFPVGGIFVLLTFWL